MINMTTWLNEMQKSNMASLGKVGGEELHFLGNSFDNYKQLSIGPHHASSMLPHLFCEDTSLCI